MSTKYLYLIILSILTTPLYSTELITPNDPYFKEQWNLHNEGPFRNKDKKGKVLGGDHAHVLEAWNFILQNNLQSSISDIGQSIKIAFIDDGFDIKHEEFEDKVMAHKNFGQRVAEDNLFSTGPNDFHGTLVTGIAVARADNNKGLAGVCPGCKVISARMAQNPPAHLSFEQYYDWIFNWVISEKPDIINCSWGPSPETNKFFQKLMQKLKNDGRLGKGIILVAAAGNSGEDMAWNPLASNPYTITVGASNSRAERQGYSNFGEGLDVLAPSSSGKGATQNYEDRIWTTDNYRKSSCSKKGRYCKDKSGWNPSTMMAGGDGWNGKYSYRFSHTSAAAPLVSAVSALILSVNPSLTAKQVKDIIRETADKIDTEAANYDLTGFSPTHGYGRINALEAVKKAFKLKSN